MKLLQIVLTLDCYGVENIRGISNGYRGFFEENLHDIPVRSITLPMSLNIRRESGKDWQRYLNDMKQITLV